jgi:hypothetical protein
MAKIGILRVKKLVDALLEYVRTDYASKADHEESFLHRCFDDDDAVDGISYKALADEIFIQRTRLDSRNIETRIMFDPDRATLPTIHVREPAKNKGKTDAIGYIDEQVFYNDDGGVSDISRRSFESQFELMITSGNRHEVLIIEEVLMGLLIGGQDSFTSQEPFYQMQLNVKELIMKEDLAPTQLFIKSIGLNLQYDKRFQDISNSATLNKILFEHKILS